ncbi:hypothetical protein V3C99_000328 [Haemonchus contortus]
MLCFMFSISIALSCFVDLSLSEDSSPLNCVRSSSGDNNGNDGNLCVLYEINSCGASHKIFYDSLQVDKPSWYNGICGVFWGPNDEAIAACFCQDDHCNTDDFARATLDSTADSAPSLPDVGNWKYAYRNRRTIELMKCLRKNLEPAASSENKKINDTIPGNVDEVVERVKAGDIFLTIFLIALLVVMVIVALCCIICIIRCCCCKKKDEKNVGGFASKSAEKSGEKSAEKIKGSAESASKSADGKSV